MCDHQLRLGFPNSCALVTVVCIVVIILLCEMEPSLFPGGCELHCISGHCRECVLGMQLGLTEIQQEDQTTEGCVSQGF
jgi:hypothetical protein